MTEDCHDSALAVCGNSSTNNERFVKEIMNIISSFSVVLVLRRALQKTQKRNTIRA